MIVIHEGDSLEIEIAVTDRAGAAVDLAGATLAAAASRSGTTIGAVTVVTDAAAGLATVTFGAGALAKGRWEFQARVTRGAESRVVAVDAITVNPAFV